MLPAPALLRIPGHLPRSMQVLSASSSQFVCAWSYTPRLSTPPKKSYSSSLQASRSEAGPRSRPGTQERAPVAAPAAQAAPPPPQAPATAALGGAADASGQLLSPYARLRSKFAQDQDNPPYRSRYSAVGALAHSMSTLHLTPVLLGGKSPPSLPNLKNLPLTPSHHDPFFLRRRPLLRGARPPRGPPLGSGCAGVGGARPVRRSGPPGHHSERAKAHRWRGRALGATARATVRGGEWGVGSHGHAGPRRGVLPAQQRAGGRAAGPAAAAVASGDPYQAETG